MLQVTWEAAYWEACRQLGNAVVQKALLEEVVLSEQPESVPDLDAETEVGDNNAK